MFPFHLDLCCCFKAISFVGIQPPTLTGPHYFGFPVLCQVSQEIFCDFTHKLWDWVCQWNPWVWPFKWNLLGSTLTLHFLFFSIFQSEMWKFFVKFWLRLHLGVKGTKWSKSRCMTVKQYWSGRKIALVMQICYITSVNSNLFTSGNSRLLWYQNKVVQNHNNSILFVFVFFVMCVCFKFTNS